MSEIVVVKLGGTTLADQQQVLAEVAAVARKRPVVLVHGGGKRMTEWLERLGVQTRFEGGLRVTDPAALEVAAAVLRGVVNSELVAALRDVGCDAVGLSGVDGGLLIGQRLPDVGLVAHGRPASGATSWTSLLVADQVPVVAPLARDEEGVVCNVNADDAAAGLAAGLGARQLVLMTDVDGVRDGDGDKLDSITRRRGRGADRRRHDPAAAWCPRSRRRSRRWRGTTPRRSSRTRRRPTPSPAPSTTRRSAPGSRARARAGAA